VSETSITVGSVIVVKLVAAARGGDVEAVQSICDLVAAAVRQPDRRVGAALGLNRRPGGRPPEYRRLLRTRDPALRELIEMQPRPRQSERIRLARTKFGRYEAAAWPRECGLPDDTGNRERDLMRIIARTRLGFPTDRHCTTILNRGPK
jgi:hypothetical protein